MRGDMRRSGARAEAGGDGWLEGSLSQHSVQLTLYPTNLSRRNHFAASTSKSKDFRHAKIIIGRFCICGL